MTANARQNGPSSRPGASQPFGAPQDPQTPVRSSGARTAVRRPTTGRPRVPDGQLSAHELAVVTELARGGGHQQIARRLGLTTTAVSTTINRANRRLDTQGPAHLVARAIATGLLPPGVALTSQAEERRPQLRPVAGRLAPDRTVWHAWMNNHDWWDGTRLYATLELAEAHAAHDYEIGKYPELDKPSTRRDFEWRRTHDYGFWFLFDHDSDTGVRISPWRVFRAAAPAEAAQQDMERATRQNGAPAPRSTSSAAAPAP